MKRSMPSLVGGIFTAIVVFVLWVLLFGTSDIALIALGVVLAVGIGVWIRVADL